MKTCGGCTLCCKLIPVEELHKLAGHRCKHQRHGRGCMIYAVRPVSCREWSCMWLIGTEAGGPLPLSRPDHVHYVIDMSPDLVRMRDDETGAVEEAVVMQVWVDPKFPDAWQDKGLLDMLERGGIAALVRYGIDRAFAIFPPSRTSSGKWERSANNEVSRAADLEEARLQARFDFFKQQVEAQQ